MSGQKDSFTCREALQPFVFQSRVAALKADSIAELLALSSGNPCLLQSVMCKGKGPLPMQTETTAGIQQTVPAGGSMETSLGPGASFSHPHLPQSFIVP